MAEKIRSPPLFQVDKILQPGLQPGAVAAGDAVMLQTRPNPDFPFSRLVEIVYARDPSREELTRMAAMDGLARQWIVQAKMALRAPDPA